MKRLIPLLIVLGITGPPALAASFYFCPDVPTDRGGTTYMPWNIVRNDSGAYSLALALPGSTATDSLHRMCSGDWLFSVEAAAELPPGGGAFHEPRDVVRYDPTLGVYSSFFCGALVGIPAGSDVDAAFLDGGDAADLILSFDVPTDLTGIGGGIYEPADLVRFKHTGAGCGGWIPVGLYFDASAAVPAVRITTNVTGADRRTGRTVMTFDVPTTLGAPTFFPGQMVSWSGLVFASFYLDGTWPLRSRVDAFSFLPDPGTVPTMHVDKSALTPGDLTITWTASLSAGAEDYGIYEGSITSPWAYNHGSFPYVKVCHDAGFDFTEEITPTAGNVYYLVVALNPDLEGSYGQNSTGERPPSGSPCRSAQGFDCP